MDLKLISTELTEETIQVTYTDGQPVDNAKAYLIVRQPFDGDLNQSFLWTEPDGNPLNNLASLKEC